METSQSDQEPQPEYQALDSTHPFVQWLRTYLLWAYITGLEPQVFTFPADEADSVEDNLRWQAQNLWVERSLLDRIPHRLLAILAVRNYMEQEIWRKGIPFSLLVGVMALALSFTVASSLQRLFGENILWHLVHLFVVPLFLEMPSLLREYVHRRADEETLQRLAEPETVLLAMEKAVEESYRNGESDKRLQSLLKRLNRVRAKVGEPLLTLEQIKAQAGEPPHRE
ncbi:MAG: hypothetical protein ACP5RN_14085, partial [Armatimonadota bacterium]